MKFVYCPTCKELRVKPWYAQRAWCSRCRQNGREIPVPRTVYTYVLYVLILAIFAMVYTYTSSDEVLFLLGSVVGLITAFILQAIEISRGERIARAKIKTTRSDATTFRKKGWL